MASKVVWFLWFLWNAIYFPKSPAQGIVGSPALLCHPPHHLFLLTRSVLANQKKNKRLPLLDATRFSWKCLNETWQAPLHSSASLICGFSERTPKTLSAHIRKYNAALMFLMLKLVGKTVRLGTKNLQRYGSTKWLNLTRKGEWQLDPHIAFRERLGGESWWSSLIFCFIVFLDPSSRCCVKCWGVAPSSIASTAWISMATASSQTSRTMASERWNDGMPWLDSYNH